jgi:hypothetical protein
MYVAGLKPGRDVSLTGGKVFSRDGSTQPGKGSRILSPAAFGWTTSVI